MPGKKPFVRRFGQVDFDSMIALLGAAADDADIFVTRRGAFGANRTLTRAQIIAGAGVVPDPLLLNDGSAVDPTYSFSADPIGMFRLGANQLGFAVNGLAQWIINPTELTAVVAGGPLLRNFDSTATVPNIISDSGDVNTGWGSAGPDILSGIAGGVEGIQISEVGGLITIPTFGSIRAPVGTATLPSYSFAGRPTTGIFSDGVNEISFALNGVENWRMLTSQFASLVGNGPSLMFEAATETNPTLIPHAGATSTGIGAPAATPSNLSLIAGSVEVIRCVNTPGVDQAIISPGIIVNDPFTPSLAFGAGNSGFYESAANVLQVSIASVQRFNWAANVFGATDAGGPAMLNEAAINTNPTIVPNRGDLNSGLGGIAGQPSLIAGGLSCISVSESGGARQIGFYDGSPIALQTGVAVTTSAVHAALVALRLITA